LSKYRIHKVAQLTGLSAALIRAWESRYSLVVPVRTPAGYRLYSDEDVAVLLGAQRLMRKGMAPMQVAKLTRAEIRGDVVVLPEEDGAAADSVPLRSAAVLASAPSSFAERIERLIDAFAAFDSSLVEQLLSPPLALLPTETVCEKLLLPLLREVGERWHRGELSIAAEHFGTSLIRKKLDVLLEALRQPGKGKRLCCACPPGEQHELGLLVFALRAAAQGWDTIYLGANLPIADLGHVVGRVQPELVCLSFVQRREPEQLKELLGEFMRVVAGRALLLVGGIGISGLSEVVLTAGAVLMPESGRLDDLLRPASHPSRAH
jgi:DNA-binding transcriptional MerR regulator